MLDPHNQFWTWLLKRWMLPAGDHLFGSKMMARLRFLEEAQWWRPERLYDERNESLRNLIHTVYNEVPFYRERMGAAGVTPKEIRTAEDLHKLPITTKASLRNNYPDKTTRATGRKTFENRTSGSTGYNFCVRTDSETEGWYRASFLSALQWTGWQIGDAHVQTGMNLKRNLERRLKDTMFRCRYVSAFRLDDSHLDEILRYLERNRIQFLWGYPSSIYFLARRATELKWNQPLRSIVTWGDTLFPQYRRMIEAAFKTRVFDQYGCAEGIQISAQCGVENTYHVHTLDVVVEYLDDKAEPVREGETGHLVLTRLFAGPMPLIRYRVGDVGVSARSRICSCGRGYEVMDSILGRETDFVLTPSGNRLIVHFFRAIFERFPQIDSFQAVQESPGSVLLRVVPAKDFSETTLPEIVSVMKNKGAADLNFEVEVVNEIPLTAGGKRRFVISKLAQPLLAESDQLLKQQ
jgi:phenylacetate-CoA ligase